MDKKEKISVPGIVLTALFTVMIVISVFWDNIMINVGSELIWRVDKNFYRDIGIYFYDNDYVVSPTKKTTTDYEFEQVCALKKRLDEAGVDLLYVNKPTKYIDDSVFKRFGVESFCNENADVLIERLRKADIEVLDLREEMAIEKINVYDMFYRTDHHWKVPYGKWGAEKIAQRLNSAFGNDIDLSVYDDDRYDIETFEEVWLGEQGAKFAGSSLKKDDYILIKPNFETHYSFNDYKSDFSEFIGEYPPFYHYLYNPLTCENEDVTTGRMLLFGDSYDAVTEPFLSLGVHSIKHRIMRDIYSNELDAVEEKFDLQDYDTVIVCYAEFMIGAHDDPSSANYAMFSFDKVTMLGN